MRGVLTVCLAGSLTAIPVERARAGTYTGGATEWTQITNMIQLIQHSVSLIQSVIALKRQCEYWYKNTKGMDSPMDVLQAAQGLAGLLARMQGLLFAGEGMLERWKMTHPGRKSPEELGYDPRDAYHKIESSTQAAVSRGLAVLDMQGNSADGWPTDRTIYANLSDRMKTASGQLQVSQVTNELLLEVIRQLHLMRQVQIAQAEMMGYHVSAESQRREYDDELRTRRLEYTGRFRGGDDDIPIEAPVAAPVDELPWPPANGPRAPVPGSTAEDPTWRPVNGPLAPAPGSTSTEEDPAWRPANGPWSPAPGSTAEDSTWRPANGPLAPAPGSTSTEEDPAWRPVNGPWSPKPAKRSKKTSDRK